MIPILIVGAGPVGLALAAELARYGVPARLVDAAPHAADTSRALVLWSRTLELMDRMGCAEAFLAAGARAHGATIRSEGAVLGHAGFGTIEGPHPFALLLPQDRTERLLHDHLATLGGGVERPVRLVRFRADADGVDAVLARPDGGTETVRTPFLVGCDGAHSVVRHGLGIPFSGHADTHDWVLADLRIDGPGVPPRDEIATFLHPDGPLVIFPIRDDRVRVVAADGPAPADPDDGAGTGHAGATAAPAPTLAHVQALLDRRAGGGIEARDPTWLAPFRIDTRIADTYRRGRVFLAGDAAHVHSPAGGQGMNTGIGDAINLAWKLAMVARRDAAATLLDSYDPERRPVGLAVLRDTGRLTRLATLGRPASRRARDLAVRAILRLPAARRHLASTMSETRVGYRDGPLSVGEGSGRRVSPARLAGPPPGHGRLPRFVLAAPPGPEAAALAARFPTLLDPAPRPSPELGRLLLIRPDGHVGLAADADDWEEADRYCRLLIP